MRTMQGILRKAMHLLTDIGADATTKGRADAEAFKAPASVGAPFCRYLAREPVSCAGTL